MIPILLAHLKKYVFLSKVSFGIKNMDNPLGVLTTDFPVWILPGTTGKFLPQMIDLDKNKGVSFSKGCYLGQEIINRTERLGNTKKHLYTCILKKKDLDVFSGDVVYTKKKEIPGYFLFKYAGKIFLVLEDNAVNEELYLKKIRISPKRCENLLLDAPQDLGIFFGASMKRNLLKE